MRKRQRAGLRAVTLLVASASVLALPAATGSAVAQPSGSASVRAASEMTLTMPASGGSPGGTVTLLCDPSGGTHPTPEDACGKLAAVNGDFYALQRAPGWLCDTGYRPVTVRATGHWQGRQVSYMKTFTNACEASVGTNFVFRFGL